MTAFSATFKLLTTQLIFLATFLYQHVKERRERSSATAKECRAEKDIQTFIMRSPLSISMTKLQMIWIQNNSTIVRVNDSEQ